MTDLTHFNMMRYSIVLFDHHYQIGQKGFILFMNKSSSYLIAFQFYMQYLQTSSRNYIQIIVSLRMKEKASRKSKAILKEGKKGRPKKIKKQQKQIITQFSFFDPIPEQPECMNIIDLECENDNEKMQAQEVNQLQINTVFDQNELKVVRINHFFKKNQQIYFEVLLGRGQLVFRQPQLLTFHVLSKGKYKRMLYNYLIKLFQSTLTN